MVVPTRGGAARLPLLLRALQNQSLSDFEIVVVVDGDIDATATLLARDWPEIRAVVFPENRGRASALSAGFAAAQGDILIRADDDFVPGLDYVAAHVAAHAAGPGGAIGLALNQYPETPYATVYGRASEARLRAAALSAPPDQTWRYWGGNVSVPREVYAAVGPYDTDYVRYGYEDIDWGWRLHEAGYPIAVSAALGVAHHVAATTAAIRARRAFLSGSARQLFETKHPAAAVAVPPVRSPWGALVAVAAWRTGERRAVALGRLADALAPVLPRPLAHKLVALSVEAAGRGGFQAASRAAVRRVGPAQRG